MRVDRRKTCAAVGALAFTLLVTLHGAAAAQAGRSRFVWSNGSEKIEISHDGDVEFTDDDTDVASIAPGGYFRISTGNWFGRGVEVRADAAGRLARRYRVGIVEKPYEPDGRAWLARTLPRFIRQSGIGAPAHVARILKTKGPPGVLAEISRIEGSYGKRIYLEELFRTGSLNSATVRVALAQASRELESDYELASLLIAWQHLAADEAVRKAYFDAASSIQSDYEMRRALSAGLKSGPIETMVLASLLSAASSIESDYDLASLLVQVAKLQPLDQTTRWPFFAAADTIDSSYEHHRVLEAVAKRRDLPPETLVALLRSAARIDSDFERSQVLLAVAGNHHLAGAARTAFLQAAERLGEYEQGRALTALVKSERRR